MAALILLVASTIIGTTKTEFCFYANSAMYSYASNAICKWTKTRNNRSELLRLKRDISHIENIFSITKNQQRFQKKPIRQPQRTTLTSAFHAEVLHYMEKISAS